MLENKNISRRQFVTTATGSIVAGGLLGAGGMKLLQDPAPATNSNTPTNHPDLPWKYVKLDPEVAANRAYEFYFSKGG